MHRCEGDVSDYKERFDIGLATHLCGEGTDLAQAKCIENNATFILTPCCVGKIRHALAGNISNNSSDGSDDNGGSGGDGGGGASGGSGGSGGSAALQTVKEAHKQAPLKPRYHRRFYGGGNVKRQIR